MKADWTISWTWLIIQIQLDSYIFWVYCNYMYTTCIVHIVLLYSTYIGCTHWDCLPFSFFRVCIARNLLCLPQNSTTLLTLLVCSALGLRKVVSCQICQWWPCHQKEWSGIGRVWCMTTLYWRWTQTLQVMSVTRSLLSRYESQLCRSCLTHQLHKLIYLFCEVLLSPGILKNMSS